MINEPFSFRIPPGKGQRFTKRCANRMVGREFELNFQFFTITHAQLDDDPHSIVVIAKPLIKE